MRGLYVHIPFCVRKCAYCDFYSLPDRLDLVDAYIDAVLRETESYIGMSFHTLYLGGGTPSLLGAGGLWTLVGGLRHAFDLSDLSEATIEVNPESATIELLQAAVDVGINRVSVGVQSLSDRELQSVGRIHSAAQAVKAISRARRIGFRSVSADVIVGLPGQEWATLGLTLETLTGLGINHLSMYCLSLEHGTPLAMNPPDDLPSDDAQAELFEQATEFLLERGFNHYEISNFALPGMSADTILTTGGVENILVLVRQQPHTFRASDSRIALIWRPTSRTRLVLWKRWRNWIPKKKSPKKLCCDCVCFPKGW